MKDFANIKDRNFVIAMLGQFPPSTGGICTNIQYLLKSRLRKKYNFIPLQTGSSRYGTPKYFDEKFYFKFCRVIKKLFYFRLLLLKYSLDVVHVNTSFRQFAFWRDSLFILMTKFFRRKILLQIHGGTLDEFWPKKSLILRKLIKKILEIPEQILVLSSIQQKPLEYLGIKQKVKVIPNMIDVNKYIGDGNHKDNLDIPSDHLVILFVAAHFFKEKGVWEVLKSIPLVIKKHNRIIFVLVGGGKEETAMKEFCIEQKLQECVKFTNHLYGKDIIRTFLVSDIFILPSYNEGFPMTILEAMAAGLPIIATSVGAIPEIIEDGINGFLIQPNDSLALAEKINQLIEDSTLRQIMGKTNINKVKEKYDLEPVAKIFDEIYSELISKGKDR